STGDGLDGVHVHMSNTLNTPVEVFETAYPLRIQRYEYRPDSGGAGRYRGGLGLRRDIEVIGHESTFSLLADRRRNQPYGVNGGESGASGEDYLKQRESDEWVSIPPKSSHQLNDGDVVSVRTPGAGGYGDPADRELEAIRRDVELGKLSATVASEAYGRSIEAIEAPDTTDSEE
ncbi:MAG: hydantoinase B/oxoprolinase family protein, partial [Halobacteriales archaeon]